MDEEAAIAWQDVLDEIAAGRAEDLGCPFCSARPLSVRQEAGVTRVVCRSCRRFIEGRLGET